MIFAHYSTYLEQKVDTYGNDYNVFSDVKSTNNDGITVPIIKAGSKLHIDIITNNTAQDFTFRTWTTKEPSVGFKSYTIKKDDRSIDIIVEEDITYMCVASNNITTEDADGFLNWRKEIKVTIGIIHELQDSIGYIEQDISVLQKEIYGDASVLVTINNISNYQQIDTIPSGTTITIECVENHAVVDDVEVGFYLYMRKESDGSTLITEGFTNKPFKKTITVPDDINYIRLNSTTSQFPGIDLSKVTDWTRILKITSEVGNKGLIGELDELEDKITELSYGGNFFNGYPIPKNPSVLKVLCIANSYVQEPFKALPAWLNAYKEVANVKIAFTYHAGCTLKMYDDNFNTENFCHFAYSTNGSSFKAINIATGEEVTISTGNYCNSLKQAIEYDNWDIITFQQGSGDSGKIETVYPLGSLMGKVRYYCGNSGIKFGWHMTWPYAKGNTNLSAYNNSQDYMYECIENVTKYVRKEYGLDLIVPSGAVMQSLRSLPNSTWGDDVLDIKGMNDVNGTERESQSGSSHIAYADFTRDGSHPCDFARYAIAACFMQKIILPCFGLSIKGSEVNYNLATGQYAQIAVEEARKACANR